MGAAAFIIAEYVKRALYRCGQGGGRACFASYAALFYITHIEASKLGLRGMSRSELPKFFLTLISGWHYLIPLCFLLYALIILRHTPQSAAFNAIWVMAVVMLLQHPVRAYRNREPLGPAFKRGIQELFASLAAGGRNMVSVALATAAAGIIVGVVALGLAD
jgi:TRAP-type uncharacterized transport system fused permease subunit